MLVPIARLPGLGGVTGLAADDDFVYAAGQVPAALGAASRSGAYSDLLVFDRCGLRLRTRYRLRLAHDVHSLVVVDGGLMVVSTGTDALVEVNLEAGHVVGEHLHWRADPLGSDTDRLHLNALARRDNVLLVSGFGCREGRNWDTARRGFVRPIDVRDGASGPVLADLLAQPHSLLVDGANLILCESRTRALRDLNAVLFAALPGYPRGLCRFGSTVFVGTSVRRCHHFGAWGRLNPSHEPGTEVGACTVVGLAATSWQLVSSVPLTGTADEIYDLLPLDPPPAPSSRDWRAAD